MKELYVVYELEITVTNVSQLSFTLKMEIPKNFRVEL